MRLHWRSKFVSGPRSFCGAIPTLGALFLATIAIAAPGNASAETRSYVVSWFGQATYSQDGDCAGGINPSMDEVYSKNLRDLGHPPAEVEALMKTFNGGVGQGPIQEFLVNRGRIDGKPVNIYEHPTSEPDPHLHTVTGKYAFGFNLDGRGAASPNSYEDPETHEKGVNNQHFRALGCILSHRALPPDRPTIWAYVWDVLHETMPAWIITLSGEDLNKDGDITVAFDRSLDHASLDAGGNTRADSTFRIDPDPREHNVFRGRIKDHVVSIEPAELHLMADPYFVTIFDLMQTHLRLKMKPDGTLAGIIGGYQDWYLMYYMYGGAGYGIESMVGIDFPGVYYELRRQADAYPDPTTGQNTRISTAYSMEAVPAFTVQPSAAKTSRAGETSHTVRAP